MKLKNTIKIILVFAMLFLPIIFLSGCDSTMRHSSLEITGASFSLYTRNPGDIQNRDQVWRMIVSRKGPAQHFIFTTQDGQVFTSRYGVLYLDDFELDVVHTFTIQGLKNNGELSNSITRSVRLTSLDAPMKVQIQNLEANNGRDAVLTWDINNPKGMALSYNLTFSDNNTGEQLAHDWAVSSSMSFSDLRRRLENQINTPSVLNIAIRTELWTTPSVISTDGVYQLYLPSQFTTDTPTLDVGKVQNPTNVHFDNYIIRWTNQGGHFPRVFRENGSGIIFNNDDATLLGVSHFASQSAEPHTSNFSIAVTAYNPRVTPLGGNIYRIYVETPATADQTLNVQLNHFITDAPTNVRIQGNNIVWDSTAPNGTAYWISIGEGTARRTSFTRNQRSLSLMDVHTRLNDWNPPSNLDDTILDFRIQAGGSGIATVSINGSDGVFDFFRHSEQSLTTSQSRIRLMSIAAPRNVVHDIENRTISWSPVFGASGYRLFFYRGQWGSSFEGIVQLTPNITYSAQHVQGAVAIYVVAFSAFSLTTIGGITTLYVSSVYRINL